MIKTIVVPTDGSSHAMKAVELAADIAAKYGARLVLLHALLREATPGQLRDLTKGTAVPKDVLDELDRLEKMPIEAAAMAGMNAPIFVPASPELLKKIGDLIGEKAREAAKGHGLDDIDLCVVDGPPTERILELADRENADMIVMGNRGFGKLKGLLLGSVSHKVSHLSKCTCVTVK